MADDDAISTTVKNDDTCNETKDDILHDVNNKKEDDISSNSEPNDKDNVATDKGSAEIMVGGDSNKPPAYAMLVGFDVVLFPRLNHGPNSEQMQVPIHSLPTILGRTHQPCNIHQFVPLGNCKALSRNHAKIFYCDEKGGYIESQVQTEVTTNATNNNNSSSSTTSTSRNDCVTVDAEFNYRRMNCKKRKGKRKDITASADLSSPPPCNSGFAIECLGKNKIFVGKQRLEQGQIAPLENGTPIKMASYCFYFVLPKSQRTRSVSFPDSEETSSVATNEKGTDHDENSSSPPVKKLKRQYNRKAPLLQMEDRPLDELLREFHHAIETDVFDRKHQMVSSGIMMYAVKTVAADSEMIHESQTKSGLSRSDIMDFIEKHTVYSKWVKRIMTKMELKTYQSNLSKALVKAGYERVGTTGRHVKWLIPGIDYERNVAASKQDLMLPDTVTSNQVQIKHKEETSECNVNNNNTTEPTGSCNERSESESMNFITNSVATNPIENLEPINTDSTIGEIPLVEKETTSSFTEHKGQVSQDEKMNNNKSTPDLSNLPSEISINNSECTHCATFLLKREWSNSYSCYTEALNRALSHIDDYAGGSSCSSDDNIKVDKQYAKLLLEQRGFVDIKDFMTGDDNMSYYDEVGWRVRFVHDTVTLQQALNLVRVPDCLEDEYGGEDDSGDEDTTTETTTNDDNDDSVEDSTFKQLKLLRGQVKDLLRYSSMHSSSPIRLVKIKHEHRHTDYPQGGEDHALLFEIGQQEVQFSIESSYQAV